MILECSIEILSELLKFKLSEDEVKPSKHLYQLIIDGQRSIDIKKLEVLFYLDKKCKPKTMRDRIKLLNEDINLHFHYCIYNESKLKIDCIPLKGNLDKIFASNFGIIQTKDEHEGSTAENILKRRIKIITELASSISKIKSTSESSADKLCAEYQKKLKMSENINNNTENVAKLSVGSSENNPVSSKIEAVATKEKPSLLG